MKLEQIREMQRKFLWIILPWETDGSTPSRFYRRTAMGKAVVTVDPWCGGFASDALKQRQVGWSVEMSGQRDRGICSSSEAATMSRRGYIPWHWLQISSFPP